MAERAPLRAEDLASARRFVGHYLRAWRGSFAALFALVVGAATCAVGIQYLMKILVDAMTARDAAAAWGALAAFIALVAAESSLWRASGWLACRTTIGVGVDMRLDLFRHLAGQPMRYFADHLAGSLGQRITATAGNFGALANATVWRIAPPAIDFVGALAIFATIDLGMAAALAATVPAMVAGLLAFGGRGRPLHATYAAKSSVASGELVDVISNMWAVKAFTAGDREYRRLRRRFEDEAAAQRASWMYTEKQRAAYDFVLWGMAAGMLSWALHRWAGGAGTPGDVVVVSALTFRILHGSRDVAIAGVEALQQLGFIEDTLRAIAVPQAVRDRAGAGPLVRRGGTIAFRRVSFRYDDGPLAVRDLSFEVAAGEKLGIVGPSGAGKSTVVHLIQRLYDVDEGEVLIDGQPVDAVAQDTLRATLAVVPQEIALFHRSIAENIRFGRPAATRAEVLAAATAARCDAFVRRLPLGYDTLVGERGVKLSGGQRQRIGIARALLKDAPILILDEATSALDTESEVAIQRNLVETLRPRTVVTVAHRLSTLVDYDRILVIAEGRIVEEGTAAELRRRGGLFERLWRLQAEGLAEAGGAREGAGSYAAPADALTAGATR